MVEDFDSEWYMQASTNQAWAYSHWHRARELEEFIRTQCGPFLYKNIIKRIEELEAASWRFLLIDVWEM